MSILESLLEDAIKASQKTVREKYQPLFDAGYSADDVCLYRNTYRLAELLGEAMLITAHTVQGHDDLAAANLDVAIMEYMTQREDALHRAHKLMGDTREKTTTGPELLRQTIVDRDALKKKLDDRAELEASLHAAD